MRGKKYSNTVFTNTWINKNTSVQAHTYVTTLRCSSGGAWGQTMRMRLISRTSGCCFLVQKELVSIPGSVARSIHNDHCPCCAKNIFRIGHCLAGACVRAEQQQQVGGPRASKRTHCSTIGEVRSCGLHAKRGLSLPHSKQKSTSSTFWGLLAKTYIYIYTGHKYESPAQAQQILRSCGQRSIIGPSQQTLG